ncbi:beta-galactosidase family protein [Streptomyces sp. NPDC088923]|uniref:glycoside hydrolase family 35 protein n=1 Tax=Streptomyces sp. NPDC088923 TaxID=3365913 RepID=UPI0038164041
MFEVGERDFLVDGRPVRLLSGALHYFRVHEGQWAHRLGMLRALGLNCVETYVPWNLHEPERGRYEDVAALGRFLDAAAEAGLYAIVRPGPYICAEWENGGLPVWLRGPLRTRDASYTEPVAAWFRRLLPQVVERQADRGGPVVMVQVENEYGSFGSDAVYLEWLAGLLREVGVTVPLCTSDGPEDWMLSGGTVPGVLATVNFGSGSAEALATLRRARPEGPLMVMEFWCGWFTHWGDKAVERRDAADAAAELRAILDAGASVNLYMAHGGSNGGWEGANRLGEWHDGAYTATTTSYDYDAPIDEAGRPTRKFHLMREVLAPYARGPLPELPAAPLALGAEVSVRPEAWAPLDALVDAVGGGERESAWAPSFEDLGVDRGLVRYRLRVPGPRAPRPLRLPEIRDLCEVYVDGVRVAPGTPVGGGAEVELWVESLGRVNYGPRLGEPKGLPGGVLHATQYLHGVRATPLRLRDLDGALPALPFAAPPVPGARGLHRAVFATAAPGDAWLSLPGWGRGFVWLNGECLGRYWSQGPQTELFVPGPVLRAEGENELRVLELAGPKGPDSEGEEAGAVRLRPVEG